MVEYGYALMGEEHSPQDLVRNAQRAEEAGFAYALVSDHYHPWIAAQGHAPFVWNVIGGIAQVTDRIRIGTGVTCPTTRMHPAIVAQAAATSAVQLDGRFFLGVGSGENLNEHVVGAAWPATDLRQERLAEAIEIIRALFSGDLVTIRGDHVTVEDAQLFTRPDEPPPIVVAASGSEAAILAGELGDGLVGLAPSTDIIDTFLEVGGIGPRYAQVDVCWAPSEDEAAETVLTHWPQTGLKSDESTMFRTPAQFEDAVELVTRERVADLVALGPDPERHVEMVRRYVDAGYDHVYLHQVGPDQEGFFDFFETELRSHLP